MTQHEQSPTPPPSAAANDADSATPGDIPAEEFRAAMHRAADMVADYLEGVGNYPVMPKVVPGDIRGQLDDAPPAEPASLDRILSDYSRIIEPTTTHWNHPGFLAYFAITGSGPGIIAETLASALNVNAMLWRTGPAATELEEHVCDWLRQAMGLPAEFVGHINDTASIASLLAVAAARHRLAEYDIRRSGMGGRPELPRLTVYASEHAHSSIDKACVALGLGLDNLRKIESDAEFRMRPAALADAVQADRRAGHHPLAVVATVGTTSTTSVDPVPEIAAIASREKLWLHVDAAYAGTATLVPELRELMPGLAMADSLVTNPHKWMFVPVDCSVLFVRDPRHLREAFSIVPDYLTTTEQGVTNLMDYGVQLGRRFRALKLWMVMRAFGLDGIRQRIRLHCALAREFQSWVEADARFELCAPVPFSTVCFRARADLPPDRLDALNEQILAQVNEAGPVFLSHTRLHGRLVMRLTVGNLRTRREHIETAWRLIGEAYDAAARQTQAR